MREIEVLVKVLESKRTIRRKLSRFKIDHIATIVDQYYYHPKHKGFLPTKHKNSLKMLRIRSKTGKNYLTYKQDVFTDNHWAYSDEYETEIKDPKIFADILSKLGFLPMVKVINNRTYYYQGNFEICLEEVKGLGLFLEIECVNPGRKKPEKIRDEIFALIRSLDLKVSEESMAGKGEMLYRKKVRIQ